MLKDVKKVPAGLGHFFTNPLVDAAIQEALNLAVPALPIVQEIAELIPNRTFKEVADAYAKFGVPLARVTIASNDPQVRGDVAVTVIENLMLDLGAAVLQKCHAPAAADTLLNTAVQLAMTILKSSKPVSQQSQKPSNQQGKADAPKVDPQVPPPDPLKAA